MKLKAFVKDINEVDEEHRALYVEELDDKGQKTGRWKLDAEGVEDVSPLKSAFERQKEENRRLREQAERFKNINPEEYQRLMREAQEREQREESIRREAEERIREATDTHQREVQGLRQQISDVTSRYHDLYVETQLYPEIAEAKGEPVLLLPHMKGRVRVKDDKGKLRLEVLNAEGAPLLTKESKPASPKDLVAEFRESERFARAFEGSGHSGSGSGGGSGGGAGGGRAGERNPFSKDHWNKMEQARVFRQNADLANTMAQQAGYRDFQHAAQFTRPR